MKPLLSVLQGNVQSTPPMWMMRQAGRHLPEYMEIRGQAKNFLDFCYSPSLATEATLQPIRRYGMDGAILFADILLVLDAMGLDVHFEKGVGPIVEEVPSDGSFKPQLGAKALSVLSPVFETVSRVKAQLPSETTLIGFAGAPWTVGLYAIEGRGKTDKSRCRLWAYQNPEALDHLLDAIIDVSVDYLIGQVEAGADALMLFDSWAEGLSPPMFEQVVIEPTRKLVNKLRDRGVTVPIIGFPRAGGFMLKDYVESIDVQCVGLSTEVVPEYVSQHLPTGFPVQGQLDPLALIAGGNRLDQEVDRIIAAYKGRPHIFNLGHGVRPETPIAHVEQVIRRVRGQ